MPEILTDEQAAAIWSGQTTSILGLEPTTKTTEEIAAEAKAKADAEAAKVAATTTTDVKKVDDKALVGLFAEKEDEEVDDTTVIDTTIGGKKPGRKPSDLVAGVNQMIEEGLLLAAEDDNGGTVEIKTIDDAKKIIKSNLEHKQVEAQENWWDEKKRAYSPQIQAILHYADQGAQSANEIVELLGAIKEVEDAAEIDIKTPGGAERAIRDTYKSKGFKDAYVDKQINVLKDLGGTKLQEEAAELYPELLAAKQELVKAQMQNQEQRRRDAEEASKIYVSTIKKTLDKDVVGSVKLAREDKAKLYEAVTQARYTSLNGTSTNLFVKTLEELQFGKNADYDHFMNIVQFAIDPKGFTEKLKTSVTNAVTDETFRKLKTAKTGTANTDAADTASRTQTKGKVIPKTGFVNPYS